MGLLIKSFAGGSVELRPNDTANNVTLSVSNSNGILVYADSSNGGMFLPTGNTTQRPTSNNIGMMRFDTTTGSIQVYNGSSWG